jgi:hypothetical protein
VKCADPFIFGLSYDKQLKQDEQLQGISGIPCQAGEYSLIIEISVCAQRLVSIGKWAPI